MSTFALEIWHKGSRCTLYSVRQDIDDTDSFTEADWFFEKYGSSKDEEIYDAVRIMLNFLTEEISNNYGARWEFFNRSENKAYALPYKQTKEIRRLTEVKHFYPNFPLRLYCYRVSNEILILFNGGEKTAHSAQESKNLSFKFYEAQGYCTKIEEALKNNIITIHGSELRTDDTEIIL